jgi:branched-subunit amino acid aminotransferase/4-amino-4-deoxychorismate lyase
MNGLISQKGREFAVPTPFNDAVIEAMRAVDDGTLPQNADHVERVMRAAGR